MASTRETENTPELREFVKSFSEKVYNFCFYMLSEDAQVERAVLNSFRKLGGRYKKVASRRGWSRDEMSLELFQITWDEIEASHSEVSQEAMPGRDTRKQLEYERSALDKDKIGEGGDISLPIRQRLLQVDVDFRAPVVLRDLLGMNDESVARILGLRWGVYRHRLHRGRLELLESQLKPIRLEPLDRQSGASLF